MSYMIINIRRELKKLATGKQPKITARELAALALDYVPVQRRRAKGVVFLERLYRLKDTR
jgi:hypothetical protein